MTFYPLKFTTFKLQIVLFSFFMIFSTISLSATVIIHLLGQLGNQFFQIAAAVALAQENKCDLYFPDFENFTDVYLKRTNLETNYNTLFYRIPNRISWAQSKFYYSDTEFRYRPIPYQSNIELSGFFESEKYFKKYRNLIVELFATPDDIEEDLARDFSSIIDHPNTVGIHVRTYYRDFKDVGYRIYNDFLPPDIEYYKKAIDLFDPNALFVVFSDHISWCKKQFKGIDRNFIFIEGQDYLHDFYLLSKCKNVIMGSSTFSWWAAYLNQNSNKQIICRQPFQSCRTKDDPQDILCDGWIPIYMRNVAPAPIFDED